MYIGKIVAMNSPQILKASLGPKATLDDVFLLHTGSSIKKKEISQMSKRLEVPSLTSKLFLRLEQIFNYCGNRYLQALGTIRSNF